MQCSTKLIGSIEIDINESSDVLFIYWSDVKNMVLSDMMAYADNSELLGFCNLVKKV